MKSGDQTIRLVKLGPKRRPIGSSHGSVRWPDEVHARALALRDAGVGRNAISRELGVPQWTVSWWLSGRRRAQPVAAVVVKVGPPKSRKPQEGPK